VARIANRRPRPCRRQARWVGPTRPFFLFFPSSLPLYMQSRGGAFLPKPPKSLSRFATRLILSLLRSPNQSLEEEEEDGVGFASDHPCDRRRRVHRQPHGATAAPAGLPRRRRRQPRQRLTDLSRPRRRARRTQRRKPRLPQGTWCFFLFQLSKRRAFFFFFIS
jgi:hypothetical protein